jgi:thioredoxin 1
MEQASAVDGVRFEQLIGKGVTLVDFNAPWCAPCRIQSPIISQLSQKYKGRAAVMEINVDENQRQALKLGITSIPTMIIFKDGREMKRFVGLQSAEDLTTALEQVLQN